PSSFTTQRLPVLDHPRLHASQLRPSFVLTAPPPPALYTLSLHDALPISKRRDGSSLSGHAQRNRALVAGSAATNRMIGIAEVLTDRKSTRLNSSHVKISYAVFCLKKKRHVKTWSDVVCFDQTLAIHSR